MIALAVDGAVLPFRLAVGDSVELTLRDPDWPDITMIATVTVVGIEEPDDSPLRGRHARVRAARG